MNSHANIVNSTNNQSKIISLVMSIALGLFTISGSIALPLNIRSFYYLHIDKLGIAESSGFTVSEIKTAFNSMMNYCMGFTSDFSLGTLTYSKDGMDHFTDVRGLFILDMEVLLLSALTLSALFLVSRKLKLTPYYFKNHTPAFWSSVFLLGVFGILALLASIDFDRAFTLFHTIFFPGKDNWIFYVDKDPIITILPEVFFRNCAILIIMAMFLLCLAFIIHDYLKRRTTS